MTQTPLTLRRWQRAEYERLVRLGVFRGEPVELIGGQLLVAEPQYAYYSCSSAAGPDDHKHGRSSNVLGAPCTSRL